MGKAYALHTPTLKYECEDLMDNFGDDLSYLEVTYGEFDVSAVEFLEDHKKLVINVGSGEGLPVPFKLDVLNQGIVLMNGSEEVEEEEDVMFRYKKPTIDSVGGTPVRTRGGLVTVVGSNFGRPNKPTLTLRSRRMDEEVMYDVEQDVA